MHRKLLLMAFDKVRGELNDEGIKSPSINQCAKKLSFIISESFAYGDRRLRDFYNEAISETGDDIEIPQKQVILALSKYIGFKDYRDFENRYFEGKEEVKIVNSERNKRTEASKNGDKPAKPKRMKIIVGLVISISFLLAIGFFGYHYINKQQWMEWNGTRYVESTFDSQKLTEGSLKAYKEERINEFKRVLPNCKTKFFNDDGSPRIWYGKRKDGNLQYFTSYGLHPETGKTLKPITEYMIGKYICP